MSTATVPHVTRMLTGTMAMTMSVSFHWTAKATMKALTKVERAWMVRPSFSEMPLLMRLPLVEICPETDDEGESKKGISWRRICWRKVMRSFLVVRMAVMEMRTCLH
jgi:hypothetical protein